MPYLENPGIVFVAIPKTGTTSITRALRQIPDHGKELKMVSEPIDAACRARYNLDATRDTKPGRAKHLSALQLKYILGEKEFERCLTFSVVRNPWARMASRYFFTHVESEPPDEEKLRRGTTRNFHRLSFERWLYRIWMKHKVGKRKNSQLRKLTDLDGNLLVDHVGRLEDVQRTLDWVSAQTGIERMKMPHINGTHKGHYARHYSARTRDMVAEICREDIDYFGYRFDGEPGQHS